MLSRRGSQSAAGQVFPSSPDWGYSERNADYQRTADCLVLIEKLLFKGDLALRAWWHEAVITILLEGYYATEQRLLLKKAPLQGYACSHLDDINPMGIAIQQEAKEHVESLGGMAVPVFFNAELLAKGESPLLKTRGRNWKLTVRTRNFLSTIWHARCWPQE